MLRILTEKPGRNEILYLFLLVILAATLLVFIIETPSIQETAVRMCNYSTRNDIPIFYIEDNDWLKTIEWGTPNETDQDNSQHT